MCEHIDEMSPAENFEFEEEWEEYPDALLSDDAETESIVTCPNCPKIVKVAPSGEFWQPEGFAEEDFAEEHEAPPPETSPYKTIRVAKRTPRKHFYW